jgi:hypothetical protein
MFSPTTQPKPKLWNAWWTLTLLAVVFTLLVLILEALGVLKDIGLVLTGVGLVLALYFGLTAATKSSTENLSAQNAWATSQILAALSAIQEGIQELKQELSSLRTTLSSRS